MGTENETSKNNPNKGTAGKDKKFKESKLAGFKKGAIPDGEWKKNYTPDLVFEKKEGNKKTIVILESSASGDRKVHIGELTQFLSFVNTFHE